MTKYKFFLFSFLLVLLDCTSCSVESSFNGNAQFLDFYLIDSQNTSYKAFLISNHTIHIKVPDNIDLSSLRVGFTHDGIKVIEVGVKKEIRSNEYIVNCSDFTKPVKFHILSSDGEVSEWTLLLYDLPVLLIETPNGGAIDSKTKRTKNCIVSIISEGDSIVDIDLAGIRGRGNSTWLDSPQKPYNIKFREPHSLLGMKDSKNWILLANGFFDRTHLHNATAFEMARMTSFPWVQNGQFLELIINDEHKGLYYLCEKIEPGTNKIRIENSATGEDEGQQLNGFLLETLHEPEEGDSFFVSDYINTTGWTLANTLFWEYKYPKAESLSEEQKNSIISEINHLEMLLTDDDSLLSGKYRAYFDIESAIDWLLVEDATMNKEAASTKNVFMYKSEQDGLIHIGPPWDFDAWTFGDREKMKGSIYPYAFYYRQLMKDPYFVIRLKEKWAIYRHIWEERIPIYIDQQYGYIRRSALRNESIWTNTYKKTRDSIPWYSPRRILHVIRHPYYSYDRLISNMKEALLRQLDAMDKYYSE